MKKKIVLKLWQGKFCSVRDYEVRDAIKKGGLELQHDNKIMRLNVDELRQLKPTGKPIQSKFKGTYKLATDKNYRARIAKSGLSNLSVFQMISGLEPSDNIFGRAAHITTKLSGFQAMNKVNQYVAAAAGHEYVKNLVDVSNGKGTGLSKLKSKSWARDNLKQLGLPEDVKKLSERRPHYRVKRASL